MHVFTLPALSLLLTAALIPLAYTQGGCNDVLVRKEWRTLSILEKKIYLAAVYRLQKSVSSDNGDSGAGYYSRMHEQYGQQGIHSTPMFLPWHRHFTRHYELALRKLAPKAVQHYWDASLDHEDFWSAPVFQSTLGFGGMGVAPNGCVQDGPFRNLKPYNWTCLERSTNRTAFVTPPAVVNNVIANNNRYWDFARPLDFGFHISVHLAIGGIMGKSFLSPGDPVFFLHHANVDRLWAIWQLQALSRLTDYGGPRNDPRIDLLTSKLIGYEDVTVSDVMDIQKLCYGYDDVQLPGTKARMVVNTAPQLAQRSDLYEEEERITYPIKEVYDLGELVNIHYPSRVPDSMLKMHKVDEKFLRQYEEQQNHLIDELNALPGFVSPSCLINRDQVLLKKIRENPCRKLTCSIRGKKTQVKVGSNPEETLNNLIQLREKLLKGERKPTVKTLSSIIGKPSLGTNTLYNPFEACRK